MWQTLVSAIVGGVIALGGWTVQDQVSYRRRRRSLRSALAAEISSLVELARRQDYATELRQFATMLTTVPMSELNLMVPVRQAYFTVFESNAATLGELPAELAADVVRFYQGARSLLDSVSDQRPAEKHIDARLRAARYREIADGVDELCALGDHVSRRLRLGLNRGEKMLETS